MRRRGPRTASPFPTLVGVDVVQTGEKKVKSDELVNERGLRW